jgi:hypothetical protein
VNENCPVFQRLIGCVSVFQRISKQKQVSFATF